MALHVHLYTIADSKIKIGKTLSADLDLTGVLLEADVDVSDPTLILEKSTITQTGASATFWTANYAWIPDFDRYYFITQRTILNNNHFLMSFHVDVLKTYASTITGNRIFVKRSESAGSWYLPDSGIPMSSELTLSENATSFQPFTPLNTPAAEGVYFVICVAQGNVLDGMTPSSDVNLLYHNSKYMRYYGMSLNSLQLLMNEMTSTGIDSWLGGDAKSGVFSIHALPFQVSWRTDEQLSLCIGAKNWSITAYDIKDIYKTSTSSRYLLATPADFRCSTADTMIRVFLPAVGWQMIDVSIAHERPYLVVKYNTNVITGMGTCTVYLAQTDSSSLTDKEIINTFEYNVAVSVPLTASNAAEKAQGLLSAALTSALSIGGAIASQNPAIIAASIGGAAANAATQMMTPLTYRQIGSTSGGNTVDLQPTKMTIHYVQRSSPTLDSGTEKSRFASQYGILYNETDLLSNLSGFTTADGSTLPMPAGATAQEYDEILHLLEGGVII